MKNKYIYIFPFLIVFIIMAGTVYAYDFISNNFGFQYRQEQGNGDINYTNDNSGGLEDLYINTGYNGVLVQQVSRYNEEYINNGLRLLIKGISDNSSSSFFSSKRFGRFEIRDGKPIKGYKAIDSTLSTKCPDETLYYSLTGSIYSYVDVGSGSVFDKGWGKIGLLENDSYFCPRTKHFSLVFDSRHLGKMEISTGVVINEYEVVDAYGNKRNVNSVDSFDNKKVYINGLVSGNNKIDYNSINYTGEIGNRTSASILNIGGKENPLSLFRKNLKKNILDITRNIVAIKNEDGDAYQQLDNFDENKEVFYYDFEGSEGDISNEDNKGIILEIGDDGNSKIPIEGLKILIVKGGNIYINTNIYNKNKDSLLVIIVDRDSNNIKNGGNIYINPDVTNIDAVLISEGSLLSFSSDGYVLNAVDNSDLLRKQLLIYGSISTHNTIGKNITPYNSDKYIKDGGIEEESILYNLENLRSFEAELVTGGMYGEECGEDDKIRSMGLMNGSRKYMFAGRKECYLDDLGEEKLRTTKELSPLVILYNPILQSKKNRILKNN